MRTSRTEEKKEAAAALLLESMGPRMQQVLQRAIAPWKREEVSDEEAQLAEIKRRPVRRVFDAEEAKRRLGTKPAKRRRTTRKPATA